MNFFMKILAFNIKQKEEFVDNLINFNNNTRRCSSSLLSCLFSSKRKICKTCHCQFERSLWYSDFVCVFSYRERKKSFMEKIITVKPADSSSFSIFNSTLYGKI